MINGGFEETLERNGAARGDVKSKCCSARLHVHFSPKVLGGRSVTEALAIYQASWGGLGRGCLGSDWVTSTGSESYKCLRESRE